MNINNNENSQYFYIEADIDHVDLEDIFQGEYDKNKKMWKFDINKKNQVVDFLNCSNELNELELNETELNETELNEMKQKLHRSNSFNELNNSDDESDESDESSWKSLKNESTNESDDSFDEKYKRKHLSKRGKNILIKKINNEIKK